MCVSNPDRSPLESTAETQPQLQPALLRLSAMNKDEDEMGRESLSSAIVCSLNMETTFPHYGESRRIGRMIWKNTNLCKRLRSCSSPRKSAQVWCRAKILAALAKRFVDPGLQKKWPRKKSFLAIGIDSDMKTGGESLGTISRNYEGVGNPSVYLLF